MSFEKLLGKIDKVIADPQPPASSSFTRAYFGDYWVIIWRTRWIWVPGCFDALALGVVGESKTYTVLAHCICVKAVDLI